MKTQVQKLQKHYKENRQLVQLWTGLSLPEYNNLLFETGCQYAQRELGGNEQHFNLVLQSSQYWKWWENQWNRRNEEFIQRISIQDNGTIYYELPDAVMQLDQFSALIMYKQLHSVENLNIFPSRTILDGTFKQLKETTKQTI